MRMACRTYREYLREVSDGEVDHPHLVVTDASVVIGMGVLGFCHDDL